MELSTPTIAVAIAVVARAHAGRTRPRREKPNTIAAAASKHESLSSMDAIGEAMI